MIQTKPHVEDRRQLNVRVPQALVDALKQQARAEGEREAVVVRRILRNALGIQVASNIETR